MAEPEVIPPLSEGVPDLQQAGAIAAPIVPAECLPLDLPPRGGPATGNGGKGQARTSGAVHAKGHLAGTGGKGSGGGRQWPQPQRSFRQPPPRSPPGVSAGVRVEEEREARRYQAARYEALAHVEHQRHRRQPPEQGPDIIYQLEMEPARTGMRGGQAEQSSAAVQGSGAEQVQAGRGKQGKGAGQQGLQERTGEGPDSTE